MQPTKYASVKVYGTEDCPDTTDARAQLEKRGVDFEFIDIAKDSGAATFVRSQSNGLEKKPVITIAGETLVEPRTDEFVLALRRQGLTN